MSDVNPKPAVSFPAITLKGDWGKISRNISDKVSEDSFFMTVKNNLNVFAGGAKLEPQTDDVNNIVSYDYGFKILLTNTNGITIAYFGDIILGTGPDIEWHNYGEFCVFSIDGSIFINQEISAINDIKIQAQKDVTIKKSLIVTGKVPIIHVTGNEIDIYTNLLSHDYNPDDDREDGLIFITAHRKVDFHGYNLVANNGIVNAPKVEYGVSSAE